MNKQSLSNTYSHYYIDKEGNEIMTLQNFIRLQALRMGTTHSKLISEAGLSYPTYQRSFKELLSIKSLDKLASHMGVTTNLLKVLPIDDEDFERMKSERYTAPSPGDSEEVINEKVGKASEHMINSLNKSNIMKRGRHSYQTSASNEK